MFTVELKSSFLVPPAFTPLPKSMCFHFFVHLHKYMFTLGKKNVSILFCDFFFFIINSNSWRSYRVLWNSEEKTGFGLNIS